MKYFIDTHDKTKGSFPARVVTEQEFFDNFDALDAAAHKLGAFGHAAHVNLKDGKAFCFMSGPDGRINPQGACGNRLPLRIDHRGEARDRRGSATAAACGNAEAQSRLSAQSASTTWERRSRGAPASQTSRCHCDIHR